MSKDKKDVLIIGGGLAGCTAAYAANKAGKDTEMLFLTGGATEISGGALDICGVIPGEKPTIVDDYREGIKELSKTEGHAYSICGKYIDDGVKAITKLAEEGGYRLVSFDGKNVWNPNMMGSFTVNALVPEMMEDAVLVPGKSEKILVVGIKGNVAFNAGAAAVSYNTYEKKLGGKAEYYSTQIALTGFGDRRKLSDGELADYLDTEAGIAEFTEKLRTYCVNSKYKFDKMLLPPVLGFINYAENLKKIKEVCGCKAAEVEALGNSITGFRFSRAIYKGLKAAGIKITRGTASKISVENGVFKTEAVIGITDQLHSGTKKTILSNAAVLATGGLIGGGVKAHRTEVFVELVDENLGKVGPEKLSRNPVNPKGQDVLKMGIKVNADLTVKNEGYDGRLFACGDVLSGHNMASERSGSGVAMASGFMAGVNAAAR